MSCASNGHNDGKKLLKQKADFGEIKKEKNVV